MVKRMFDQLRQAAAVQKEYRDAYGADADAMIANDAAARLGLSRAETTYRQAMAKNEGLRFQARDIMLPQEVLRSDETVHDVAVGALRSDTFPLLLVTDQRVLYVMQRLRGWKVLHEAPAASVTGADLDRGFLTGKLRVHVRDAKDIVLKVAEQDRAAEVAALLQHLAAGGAPPR